MIRYLSGLNEADARRELQAAGLSAPPPEMVDQLCERHVLLCAGAVAHWLGSPAASRFLDAVCDIQRVTGEKNEVRHFLGLPSYRGSWTLLGQLAKDGRAPDTLPSVLANLGTGEWRYPLHDGELVIDRPLLMGILNVTPDSFSDGGRFLDADRAVAHAAELLAAGADIVDVGAESTRPGAPEVPLEDEWARLAPVLPRLARLDGCRISIDTRKAEIARRALREGAHIINDISGMTFDPQMAAVAAEFDAPLILMHLQGTPKTMQERPHYEHLISEILELLTGQCRKAQAAGVRHLIIDPGIGFGKRPFDNWEIIRRLGELRVLGLPILLGASRKAFIGNLLGASADQRVLGTVIAQVAGAQRGAAILRVHDVREMRDGLQVWTAIQQRKAAV